MMFEDDLPKRKIGVLSPLPVIDNGPFEFYRLVKDRIMLVLIPVGLSEFTGKDVERVFAPIDSYLDKLMERRVDIVVQSGVPLPALIGVAAHDRLIAHMADYTGRPATSSILGVVEAAINKIKTSLSQLGTAANQIATQTNFVKSLTDSLTGGVSQLVDADLAAESANLQSLQTKQQLGIQALSIANQGPGAVLTLFR